MQIFQGPLSLTLDFEMLEFGRISSSLFVHTVVGSVFLTMATMFAAIAQKKGGELTFVVASKIPTYDGHAEGTFGMVHPIRPFYSLLIRVNPDNPSSPMDFVCDVCAGEVPQPTNAGKTYSFTIRRNITFHDGTPLTAHDVVATFNKIVFPPKGIRSPRQSFFKMIRSITAPDDYTVVFDLKHPTGAFMPAVAMPFNFIYSKKDLDQHGYKWHQKNINGTGAFVFETHQSGAFVKGKRYARYHHRGKPFIDRYTSISAPQMSARLQALRGNRADAEFRGFPPKARDDLVRALGPNITIHESPWGCNAYLVPNQLRKPFDDPRVRRALNLALDRWRASEHLARVAVVKTVGGIVYPKHRLAANETELATMEGFWKDIANSRQTAKRLLKEAGASGLRFTLSNRAVDQPYKILGTWTIDEWRKIGLDVKQDVVPTGLWIGRLRTNEFDVSTIAYCQSIVNPIADVSIFLCSAEFNRSGCKDQVLEDLYAQMSRSSQFDDQRALMRRFERRALSDQAHLITMLWWHRIVAHRSYVRGWKISPSHYLNQHLDQIWLDR